jgi:hypothetical protein
MNHSYRHIFQLACIISGQVANEKLLYVGDMVHFHGFVLQDQLN